MLAIRLPRTHIRCESLTIGNTNRVKQKNWRMKTRTDWGNRAMKCAFQGRGRHMPRLLVGGTTDHHNCLQRSAHQEKHRKIYIYIHMIVHIHPSILHVPHPQRQCGADWAKSKETRGTGRKSRCIHTGQKCTRSDRADRGMRLNT